VQSGLAHGWFHAGAAFFIVNNMRSTHQPKRFLSAKFLVGLSVFVSKMALLEYTHQRFFIFREPAYLFFNPGAEYP